MSTETPEPARRNRVTSAMDIAPTVELGGRTVVILGGDVSSIPARLGEPAVEVVYESGRMFGKEQP